MNIRSSTVDWLCTLPVYHFTFHAYRSWMPDRPRGYVRRGEGILQQDSEVAETYNRTAAHPPITFSDDDGWTMIRSANHLAALNEWILYEMAATANHVHTLLGWRMFQEFSDVSNRLKRGFGAALSKSLNKSGPWFSRGSSRKRVTERSHFEHLLEDYLPNHGKVRWTLLDKDDGSTADIHPQL